MNAPRVLILGSGPAAAFAVLACQDAGADFTVMSDRPASVEQAGAFFIHWVPERLGAEPAPVQVWGTGTREGYLMKQWGIEATGVYTSYPTTQRVEQWYSSDVLQKVWEGVAVQLVTPVPDLLLSAYGRQYDLVFHTFTSQKAGEGRALVRFPTLTRLGSRPGAYGNNLIEYSGDLSTEYIRRTVAFNRLSLEFPVGTTKAELRAYDWGFRGRPDMVLLRDIPPETVPVGLAERVEHNVVPIGRFATWDRRGLSHHAYHAVLKALDEVAV